METVFIVTSDYDEDLAKKQPWYSIKKLQNDLVALNFNVVIINSLELVPLNFKGRVIKLFGFKDLLRFGNNNYRLIFLFTSPIITIPKLLSIGFVTIVKNWNYLCRILALSIIPKWFLVRVLERASLVLMVSDTLECYFSNVSNACKYIPFSPNNWGSDSGANTRERPVDGHSTLGYFGPPYLTRHFDSVVNFFVWLEKNGAGKKTKLITRIDKANLNQVQKKYLSKLNIYNSEIVSGFLSRDELLNELLEIDVMILPFRVVMEELPIVVLESLELGIPVVTTRDSGVHLITQGQKNILILDKFSKYDYSKIIDFTDNHQDDNFNAVLGNITAINKIALGKICN